MIGSGLDSRNIVHLPGWAKLAVVSTLAIGFALCIAVIVHFFGTPDGSDWLLLGLGSVQFTITALVASILVFFSQTDSNIRDLKARTDNFLKVVLVQALERITYDGMHADRLTARTGRADLFGYEITLLDGDRPVLRMWCGLNVHRLIVIYHFRNPHPDRTPAAFVAKLQDIFQFTFGGAEGLEYKITYEPIPDDPRIASIWATVAGERGMLTDPAEKLFWAQDIAMMTESVMRTSLRHHEDVAPSLDRVTGPL